ncbi:HAD family hydrolase [Paenibacillus sp. D51F]
MPQIVAAGRIFEAEAILFDKDGTLLDFVHTWGAWTRHMRQHFSARLEERGLEPLSLEELGNEWGISFAPEGNAESYDRSGPLSMGTLHELLALLSACGYRRGLSWADARVAAHESWQHADRELDRERAALALPGVTELLAACRAAGIPMAVVTADETNAAVKHLSWLGLEGHFGEIIGTDLVERGKPYPDLAELACRRMGLDISKVVIIGDSNGDMLMAKAAGAAAAIGLAAGDAALQLPDADVVAASCADIRLLP